MKTKTVIVLSLALCLLQCLTTVSSKGVPGYVFSAEKASTNKLLKQSFGSTVYNGQDVKNLVLHNLGLLTENDLLESSQNLISQFGNRNFLSQQKLDYVFLVEDASPQAERKSLENSVHQHQAALFNVQTSENESILNQLFNSADKTSVVSSLSSLVQNDKAETFIYSTDSNVASDYAKFGLTSAVDKKGDVFLLEQKSAKKFKIAANLQSCVNSALNGKYTVDIQKRSVSDNAGVKLLTIPEKDNVSFLEFLTDICSIVGTSTLIRKDPNPSFFAFHITSLAELQKSLPEDQGVELHSVFNAAYDKFVLNVLKRYSADEVSGQLLFLNPSNNVKAATNPELMLTKRTNWERLLQQSSAPTTGAKDDPVDSTISIIFASVLVAFVIITAWVCIEIFSIDIQKDSVVYAKFLAGDYFRR